MKETFFKCILASIILCLSVIAYAEEYKAAIIEGPNSKYYADLLNAIGKATGHSFNIAVVPPGRADYLIVNNQVDLQYPMAILPGNPKYKKLKYDFSTTVLFKTSFILYTNKDKPIDSKFLKNGNPKKYSIEIDPSRVFEFEYSVTPSYVNEGSFKKLDAKNIDGLILSQSRGDKVLKELGLKSIKRELWAEYDLIFNIQKGTRGGKLDKILTDGVKKTIANGDFDKYIGPVVRKSKFADWQP